MEPPAVQYVTTSDGASIAYAVSGIGPAFVFTPPVFSHIQLFWSQNTFLRPWLEGLAARFRLVQFDGRGKGMSSRGLSGELRLADLAADLTAVVEHLGLDDFVLMASTPMTCHLTVRDAIDNPDRVRALILASPTSDGASVPRALVGSLAEQDWDSFLRSMAGLGRASDLEEDLARMKLAMTQQDWLIYVRAAQAVNLEPDLPRVRRPTLVLHPRDYIMPVEVSMKVAAAIPGARLVVLEGTSFLGDPVHGLRVIEDFLADVTLGEQRMVTPAGPAREVFPERLSTRELDVLRLIVDGKSSREIGEALVLSVRTVERHIANIYLKTDTHGRAQVTAYALQRGLS